MSTFYEIAEQYDREKASEPRVPYFSTIRTPEGKYGLNVQLGRYAESKGYEADSAEEFNEILTDVVPNGSVAMVHWVEGGRVLGTRERLLVGDDKSYDIDAIIEGAKWDAPYDLPERVERALDEGRAFE